MTIRRSTPSTTLPAPLVAVLLAAVASVAWAGPSAGELMKFAAEMAERGNWREAAFRWDQVRDDRPDDPRVLNNLAVAREVLGEPAEAKELYARALELSGDAPIRTNASLFDRFWRRAAPDLEWDEDGGAVPAGRSRGGKLGKAIDVQVGLPVPPRLDLDEGARMLVASFLHEESELFDINRELVRFLRREFRKSTDLDVLEINPPPAVPEQTLEDLIRNSEFWRYLGREFDTDLVVSGVIRYERADASGFHDVDVVSPVTGQKVRVNQFVEQEEFLLVVDLLFMDARSGEMLFRDRLQRAAVYPGAANDPITAFYGLGETIVADVLAVVTTQVQYGTRQVYR